MSDTPSGVDFYCSDASSNLRNGHRNVCYSVGATSLVCKAGFIITRSQWSPAAFPLQLPVMTLLPPVLPGSEEFDVQIVDKNPSRLSLIT